MVHRTCPGRLAVALLGVALVALCQAQPQQPTTENQARYYVYGAFLTHAVPEIMGQRVALGPELEQRLGLASGADRLQIYDALMSYTDGKRLSVRKATAEELARYKPAGKRELKAPVFTVQAGEIALLVEYDMQDNTIPFVGQLAVAYQPPVAAPRAAPPAAAPVAPPAPPAVAAPKPAPPPVVSVPKPAPPPVAVAPRPVPPAPVAPAPRPAPATEPLRPNGPCIVQPVMSEQDLANCRVAPAATAARAAPIPAAPAAVKPQARIAPPPAEPELRPTGPCEVKPVMSEQDLVNCRVGARIAPRVDPGPPPTARPQARAEPEPRKPAAPCLVKPVMSEEDLIACGIRP